MATNNININNNNNNTNCYALAAHSDAYGAASARL
jgi:hypothetical protein